MAIDKIADFIIGDKVIVGYQSNSNWSGEPRFATIVSYDWCRHTMNGKKVDNCFYRVILDDGIETKIFNRYIDHQEHPTIHILAKGKPKKVVVYSGTRKIYDEIAKYVDDASGFVAVSKKELMVSTGLLDFQIDRALDELVKNKVLAKMLLGRNVSYFANPGIYKPNENATITTIFKEESV